MPEMSFQSFSHCHQKKGFAWLASKDCWISTHDSKRNVGLKTLSIAKSSTKAQQMTTICASQSPRFTGVFTIKQARKSLEDAQAGYGQFEKVSAR